MFGKFNGTAIILNNNTKGIKTQIVCSHLVNYEANVFLSISNSIGKIKTKRWSSRVKFNYLN